MEKGDIKEDDEEEEKEEEKEEEEEEEEKLNDGKLKNIEEREGKRGAGHDGGLQIHWVWV